ncbi:P63C domain-containing protein [Comamonas kerstersii]|uniref:P63C domain-containing protein n=1 Tax=Comamonas kerstersii TaxID=225992 RepID=UPI002670040A|nr:P63C domain-containing protein [Comamonas kerstersii]
MTEEKKPKRAAGAKALAAKMTPEERATRAKKGAAARWGLKATHKGNFKEEFGIDVECYVLNDALKTAVITQRGMAEMLGLGSGGSRLPNFVFNKTMSEYIGQDLAEKIKNPLVFQMLSTGKTGASATKAHGYDATILIDVCRAILRAKGDGKRINPSVVAQAGVILGASAKAGIAGLVYALAGYDRTKEEVIEAYKMYVREEAREYEKEFSPELYEQWYRLYGLTKYERGRPWEFRYLTIDHIYKPLANSHGKVFNLAKESKAVNGKKDDKIHLFLSEVGVKALRTQVGKILGIATVSETREEYEKYIAEKVYGQRPLPL